MMNLLRGLLGTLPTHPKHLRFLRPLALACLFAGCSKAPTDQPDISTSTHEKSAPVAVHTETSWIVHSVTEEIVRLAAYAAKLDSGAFQPDLVTVTALPRDAAGLHYAVEVHLPKLDALRAPIDVPGAIWDPQAYVPFTREVFTRLHLDRQKQLGSIGGDPLALLTAPRVEIIQQENRRISQWLTQHPLDPSAHEQASLLLGTLGMRENSGSFWDTRGFCNRATAHLAIARMLRSGQGQSDCGAVGELLVGLLMDTKSDCEKRIDALTSRVGSAPELKPWTVVARLRNRRDYRIIPDPTQGTLLERIELFRAMGEAAGPQAACKALASSLKEPLADWTRILLQFRFTVDEGHQFTQAAIPFEMTETAKVFPEILKSKPSSEGFAKALNREPGHIVNSDASGALAVDVIDDGAWAMFFQRHLCHAVSRTYYFLSNVWGVKDEAEKFKTSVSIAFQKLTLFPLVSADTWDTAWQGSESPAIQELIKAHPELVSDGVWGRVPETRRDLKAGIPGMQDWFAPGLPPGTAYRFWTRALYLTDVKNMTEAQARSCYEIAPWHYGVAQKFLATRSHEHPNAAQFKELLGRYLEYYQPAMLDYAALVKGDPAEYVSITQRLAAHDPGYFLELGKYFVAHHQEKEAVAAFENGFSHQADAVQLSNECRWLVDYYATHNRTDRALEIAKFAAEVYSAGGLETMARLMERLGQPAEAEDYYLKMQERYGDKSPLSGFYYREMSKAPNSVFAGKYAQMQKDVFPNEPHSVSLSDFTAPPNHGVLIPVSNDLLTRAGIKASDIVVAIDGKQVENFRQYRFILDRTLSDELDLIVYSGGTYHAVHATTPGRRFGIALKNYNR